LDDPGRNSFHALALALELIFFAKFDHALL
jgi:hypothetical protein